MGAIYSYFFGENKPEKPESFSLTSQREPQERSNTPTLLSFPLTVQPDATSQVNSINIIVKYAGKIMTVDVYPLESVSVLLKEACEKAGKKPEKMVLVFNGFYLDVNKKMSQYPNLRGGTTVNLIHGG